MTRSRIAALLALGGCFAAGLFAVGALGGPASTAAQSPLIVVDHSIGGIAIGSSQAKVTQLYGSPSQSMPVTAGASDGVLLTYRFTGGFLYFTLVDGRVVTIETTTRYHHTDARHGSWGPGVLFSKVQLPAFHFDGCSEGLWTGGAGKRVTTVVTPAGERIASVWITLVDYYDLCSSQTQEPQFTLPGTQTTATTAGPTGPFTLNVGAQPSGLGDVISNPPGIGCPTDCTQDFPGGTSVTLTATPSEGFVFDHWAGDCSGTAPTCVVTMSGPHSVVAIFGGNGPPFTQPTGTEAGGGAPPEPPPTTGDGD